MARKKRINAAQRKAERQKKIESFKPASTPEPPKPTKRGKAGRKEKKREKLKAKKEEKALKRTPKQITTTPKRIQKKETFGDKVDRAIKELAKEKEQKNRPKKEKKPSRKQKKRQKKAQEKLKAPKPTQGIVLTTERIDQSWKDLRLAYNVIDNFFANLAQYPKELTQIFLAKYREIGEQFGAEKLAEALMKVGEDILPYLSHEKYHSKDDAQEWAQAIVRAIPDITDKERQEIADALAQDSYSVADTLNG